MEDSTHAFLLQAHSDEKMFNRLVGRLCEVGPVYAHIDLKTDISTWNIEHANLVSIENRIEVYWGDWSTVESAVRLMEMALQDPKILRLTLVSGSHYPLFSAKELVTISKKAGSVIAARPAPDQPDGARPSSEYGRRYMRSKSPNGWWSKCLNGIVNRVVYAGRPLNWSALVGPTGMRAGSAYWSLERRAAQYCVDRIRADDDLIRYFKKIVCADEKIFHTLFAELDPNNHTEGTTYVKWAGKPNPDALVIKDLESVRHQPNWWFARKFSSDRDHELLDWLDKASLQSAT